MKRTAVDSMAYLVVDVSSLAHRAFHAMGRLTTSDGRVSGHVHGFMKTLHGILKDHEPGLVVFCYDRGGHVWRQEILDKHPLGGKGTAVEEGEGYKRNRQRDDTINPVGDIERLTANLPGYHMFHPGFEADDMIAAFALGTPKDTGRAGGIGIYSGDKDLWQLVDDKEDIYCLYPKRERKRTTLTKIVESDVEAEFGVGPLGIPKVKALTGDSSDNIVGVLNASRPGKSNGCKVVAAECDDFFKRKVKKKDIEFPESVPPWLSEQLLKQRVRLRANYKVTNLRYGVRRLLRLRALDDGESLPIKACYGTDKDKDNALEVLAEFECRQIISQFDTILEFFNKPE